MPKNELEKIWDCEIELPYREKIEKLQGYLPGKKQAMFTPKTAEDNVAKREIDEAKAKIKDQLQKKIESGDINIEDVLAAPEVEE